MNIAVIVTLHTCYQLTLLSINILNNPQWISSHSTHNQADYIIERFSDTFWNTDKQHRTLHRAVDSVTTSGDKTICMYVPFLVLNNTLKNVIYLLYLKSTQ